MKVLIALALGMLIPVAPPAQSGVIFETSSYRLYRVRDAAMRVTCWVAEPKGGVAWAPGMSCLRDQP